MDPRRLEMTVLMTPDMANFSGKVHGGALLNLLDRVAFSLASRYSGRYAVTLSVDQVTFKEAIDVGELVTFRASVNHAGRTSMEIGIRVEAENIRAGDVRHTNSCYFTMVAVDDAGRPAEVPALRIETETERIARSGTSALRIATPASGLEVPAPCGEGGLVGPGAGLPSWSARPVIML
jgi:acyl-CoA hydrolase